MISKELLSEVLDDYSERLVERIEINDNMLQTFYTCNAKGIATCLGLEINIYELAHKCKEWATPLYSKYYLDIHVDGISETTHIRKYNVDVMCMQDMDVIKTFESNTEPEAIFKACEWILKNQSKE